MAVQTCRHFRNQLPRDLADELRDADPAPCAVCDAMPHRKRLAQSSAPRQAVAQLIAPSAAVAPLEQGWMTGLLTFLRRRRA